MKLLIERYAEHSDSTTGRFQLKDDHDVTIQHGFTLEPAGPDTITPNKDKRIPVGTYKARWEWSGKAGCKLTKDRKLPLIWNDVVPESRKIRIHIGNYGKDTEGCILLGNTTLGKGSINESKAALTQFISHVYPAEFEVIITSTIGA